MSTLQSVDTSSREIVLYKPLQSSEKFLRSELKKHISIASRRAFEIAKKSYQLLQQYGKGDIIILAGTSTAGKSSIVKALKIYEPDRIEDDLDLRRDPTTRTPQGMEMEMIDDTIDHSLQGKKVVLHLFKVDDFARRLITRNVHIPFRMILTYCPFHELSSRVEKRNREAIESKNISNFRNPTIPLNQFGDLYASTKKRKGLETLTRIQVLETYQKNFDILITHAKSQGHLLPPDKQIAIDREIFSRRLLTKLGFKDYQHEIEVAPRNQELYHHVIDTYKHCGEEGLEEIAKMLHQRTYIGD